MFRHNKTWSDFTLQVLTRGGEFNKLKLEVKSLRAVFYRMKREIRLVSDTMTADPLSST